MQNCGQLQASIAVALIAQSDGELCPTDMQIRAAIGRSNILRIGLPPSSPKLCARKSSHARRPGLAARIRQNGRLLNAGRLPLWPDRALPCTMFRHSLKKKEQLCLKRTYWQAKEFW